MTSEEYVQIIENLMERQNMYFNIFLVMIGLFLAGIALLQWWYNTKESENIKQSTREAVMKEINLKLDIEDLIEVKIKLDLQSKNIDGTLDRLAELIDLTKGAYKEIAQYGSSSFEVFCRQSINNNTFFSTFFIFLSALVFDNELGYAKIFNESYNRLPKSYVIDREERLAIKTLLTFFENKLERIKETQKNIDDLAEINKMIDNLKNSI